MSGPMANKNGREALRGVEASVFDLIAQVLTPEEWEVLLKDLLERAVVFGNRELAQKLVGAGANIGDALHKAAGGGHRDIAGNLLENGASVATKDGRGRTPLHIAARKGQTEVVQLLLLTGADKDARDPNGWTPLYLAVHFYHAAAALALLAAGADVSVRYRGHENKSVVHLAAETGQVDILRVAIEQGVDVNDDDAYSNTPLHLAACCNNSEAIDVLVEAGANIAAKDGGGSTPLHRAAASLSAVTMTDLVNYGADTNARDDIGETPLHAAARGAGSQGAAEAVDCLLRSGADETIAGNEGTAASVVGFKIDEPNGLAEDVEHVHKLLANAPADKAWRRRGYLVLCRAHPDRMQLGLGQDSTHAGLAPRNPTGEKTARMQQSSGCNGAEGSDTVVDERNGGSNWVRAVARVLGLKEEGLFRTIMGYL